mmetsp:Transcript_67176/g.179125  ORF Transcript_67176/g.179125 Transcript_67176/m.179125 type:complete len:210 (-) Transcript_67176:214-843(-)
MHWIPRRWEHYWDKAAALATKRNVHGPAFPPLHCISAVIPGGLINPQLGCGHLPGHVTDQAVLDRQGSQQFVFALLLLPDLGLEIVLAEGHPLYGLPDPFNPRPCRHLRSPRLLLRLLLSRVGLESNQVVPDGDNGAPGTGCSAERLQQLLDICQLLLAFPDLRLVGIHSCNQIRGVFRALGASPKASWCLADEEVGPLAGLNDFALLR